MSTKCLIMFYQHNQKLMIYSLNALVSNKTYFYGFTQWSNNNCVKINLIDSERNEEVTDFLNNVSFVFLVSVMPIPVALLISLVQSLFQIIEYDNNE